MIRAELSNIVREAFREAGRSGEFTIPELPVIDWDAIITRPRPEHGDFACDLPLKLGSTLKISPIIIAESIMSRISDSDDRLALVELARPGFINFTVANSWLCRVPVQIISLKKAYGVESMTELPANQIFFPIPASDSFKLVHFAASLDGIIEAFQSPSCSEDGARREACLLEGEFPAFLSKVKLEGDAWRCFLPLFQEHTSCAGQLTEAAMRDHVQTLRDLILALDAFPDLFKRSNNGVARNQHGDSQERRIYEYCLHLAHLAGDFLRSGVLYSEQLSVLKARLGLIFAVRQVFMNGLGIIGLSTQERI